MPESEGADDTHAQWLLADGDPGISEAGKSDREKENDTHVIFISMSTLKQC